MDTGPGLTKNSSTSDERQKSHVPKYPKSLQLDQSPTWTNATHPDIALCCWHTAKVQKQLQPFHSSLESCQTCIQILAGHKGYEMSVQARSIVGQEIFITYTDAIMVHAKTQAEPLVRYVVKIGMVQSAGHPRPNVVALSSNEAEYRQELKQARAQWWDVSWENLDTPLTLNLYCALKECLPLIYPRILSTMEDEALGLEVPW